MTWQDPGGNPPDSGPEPPRPPVAPAPPVPPAYPGAYPPGATPPGMTWAPPDAGSGTPGQSGLRYAEVLPRFVAWLIDILLLGLVNGLIAGVLFGVLVGDVDWGEFLRERSTMMPFDPGGEFLAYGLVTGVISAVVDFAYFAFLWSSEGRATLGMRLLNLEIGNAADGATLDLPQAARRWLAMGSWVALLGVLPVLGALTGLAQLGWYIVLLVTTGSSPSRQGLHDRFAQTAVVQRGPAPNAIVIGCLVVAAFVGIAILVAIVALALLGPQISEIIERASPGF